MCGKNQEKSKSPICHIGIVKILGEMSEFSKKIYELIESGAK